MPPAGEGSKNEGYVAKAAGVAVVSGIAWSILKSLTSSSSSSSAPPVQVGSHAETYSVSQGDTLFSISQRFGVPLESLKAANRVHGDDIFAGDKIVIPKWRNGSARRPCQSAYNGSLDQDGSYKNNSSHICGLYSFYIFRRLA